MKTIFKVAAAALLLSSSAQAQWTVNGTNIETSQNVKLLTTKKFFWDTYRGIEIMTGGSYGTGSEVLRFSSKTANGSGSGFDFLGSGGKSILRIMEDRVGINSWYNYASPVMYTPKSLLHLSTEAANFGGGILLDQNTAWSSKFSITNTNIDGNAFFSINDVTSLVNDTVGIYTVMKDMGATLNHNDVMRPISRISINREGLVGIGTIYPDAKLTVKGDVHCEEVRVDLLVLADYVFQKYYTGTSTLNENYEMPTLEEVEEFTKANHHLPGVPSAKEIQENGLKLGEMTNILLQKVEELTLYNIEMQKQIKAQQEEIEKLKEQLK